MDTYLGQSAEEPPGASLIGLVGLFGFWFVPDEVPTIGDTPTIITHFRNLNKVGGEGEGGLDWTRVVWKCGRERCQSQVSRPGFRFDLMTERHVTRVMPFVTLVY